MLQMTFYVSSKSRYHFQDVRTKKGKFMYFQTHSRVSRSLLGFLL